MKSVKLTEEQIAWISRVINEKYNEARYTDMDLSSPSVRSFYRRNKAEDVRLRSIKNCQSEIRFLEELWDALV